ncbi:MAG: serine--tRNA ligase, partial [Kofleriaceae bacterium]|nr:serine--tRNA ligase [Kofleriaceae bacterium]
MLDPARIEDVRRRPAAVALIDSWQALDRERKSVQSELDKLRAERNAANDRMAKLDKKSAEFTEARERLKALSTDIKGREATFGELEARCEAELLNLPNAPHASVPDGAGEHDNRVEGTWGAKPVLDFAPKEHHDLGVGLGIFDFEAGGKISGARFTVLRGWGARLTRALMNYMLDLHTGAGYAEVWPPAMVRRSALRGTGQLPKFEADLFAIKGALVEDDQASDRDHDLFLSPTAEVQVTNLYADHIFEPGELPKRFCAYAPCFRAEAGAYGKDTRGLIRQHQFDKVELVKF